MSLKSLQQSIDSSLAPRSYELDDVAIDLTVDVRRNMVGVRNVLGYLPPTEESRQGEYIVVGAHYDHLGRGASGSRDRAAIGKIHNGADDNASGVAGVLELGRLLSARESRTRGVLFAMFAGEELGLRGSYHYTDAAGYRLEDAVAMINLDMIGRLRHDRMFIGGAEALPVLREQLELFADIEGVSFSSRFSAEAASDHASFIRAGVPAIFMFTGLHGDYHKPTDDIQFINYEGMERVLRISERASVFLMETEKRPELNAQLLAGSSELQTRRAAQRAYFGVGVDNSFEGEGVRFSYVAEGGPAAEAGLRAGDVLLELDGRVVGNGPRASYLIRDRSPGDTIRAKILRNDRILEVRVLLTRWP